MDSLFKRLQEVADLPNSASPQPAGAAGSADDVATLDTEELIERVKAAEARAATSDALVETLRKEASELNDQYSAYKVKVNTWREQIKASRAQDRRTIEALRAAAGNGAGEDGDAPNAGAAEAAAYAASLEEQVKLLKETVRSHATERDELQMENARLKERAMQDLRKGVEGDAAAAASTDDVSEQGEAQQRLARYAQLVEDLERDVAAAKKRTDELERANEQLTKEADEATSALAAAVETHTRQLKEVESLSSRSTTVQYAKDLEAELKAYRRQVTDLQRDLDTARASGPVAAMGAREVSLGSGDAATPPAHSPSQAAPPVAATLPAGQRDVEELLARRTTQLEQANVDLADARSHLAELEAESGIRDDTVNELFAENKALRERTLQMTADLEATKSALAERTAELKQSEDASADTNIRVAELSAALDQMHRTQAKLQRELSEKSEALRQMKLLDLQRQTQAASAQQRHSAAAALAAHPDVQQGGIDIPDTSKHSAAEQQAATTDSIIMARLNAMSWSAQYKRYMDVGRTVVSSARLRSYAVAVAFMFLVLIFMYSQSAVIHEDQANIDLLRRCKELTKIK